jgi:BON domain
MHKPIRILIAAALGVLALNAISCSIIKSTRIENKVMAALNADPRTSKEDFQVSLQADGTVRITGEVQTKDELDAVSEIAKGVTGVKQVLNQCTVPDYSNNQFQDTTDPMF